MAEPRDVASTLSELERKLAALENELRGVLPDAAPEAVPEPAAPKFTPPTPPVVEEAPEASDVTPPTQDDEGKRSAPIEAQPVADFEPEPLDAQALVAQARARITELRAELDELAGTRDAIAQTASEMAGDYRRAPEPAPGYQAYLPYPAPPPYGQYAPGYPAPLPYLPIAPSPEHTVQYNAAVIDVSYFRDLVSLSAFEQSLPRIPGVVSARVRSFAEGRALIDVQLAQPIALGIEIARLAPMRFAVTGAGPQHLALAVTS